MDCSVNNKFKGSLSKWRPLTSGVLRDRYRGKHCLTPLSVTWTVGLSVPQQCVPVSVVWMRHWRKGMPSLLGLRGGLMWTSWSSTRPSARSYTWFGAIPNTNTGRVDWGQPWGEWFGGACGWEAGHNPAMCSHSPESWLYPGLHPKAAWLAGWVRRILLCSGGIPPGVLYPAQRTPAEEDMDLLEWARRKPPRWSEGWSPCNVKTGWGTFVHCREEKLQGDLRAAFQWPRDVHERWWGTS